jgi:hypothetical protein
MQEELALDLLRSIDFGATAAERDGCLSYWFVETAFFRRVLSEDVALVVGPKGTGKSAIHRILNERQGLLGQRDRDVFIPTSGLQGPPDFSPIVRILSGADADDYKSAWKLYIAVHVAQTLLSKRTLLSVDTDAIRTLLRAAGVMPGVAGMPLGQWMAESLPALTATVSCGGVPVTFGLQAPSVAHSANRALDITELLRVEQEALDAADRRARVLIDRVDEVSSGSAGWIQARLRALEALMAAVVDLEAYSSIRPIVFMRDDLYRQLSFVNKDHLTDRRVEIAWTDDDLVLLAARRLALSDVFRTWRGVVDNPSAIDLVAARDLLWSVLEVVGGLEPRVAISQLLDLARDSLGRVSPRDLIHLLSEAVRLRLEDIEERGVFSEDDALLPPKWILEASHIVSRHKVDDFLLGEFPHVWPLIAGMECSESFRFGVASLEELAGLSSHAEFLAMLDFTYRIGFLKPADAKSVLRCTQVEVAPLYRPGLGLPSPDLATSKGVKQ